MIKKNLPFNQRIVVKVKDFDINTGEDIVCYHCLIVKRDWYYGNETEPCGYEAIQDGNHCMVYLSYSKILDYRIVEDF